MREREKPDRGIHFRKDTEGRWWRKEYRQCPEELPTAGFCQGIEGHKGPHWCYSPCGSLVTAPLEGGLSFCPPDHKRYVHPKDVQQFRYTSLATELLIDDPEEIKRLDEGKLRSGESASGWLQDTKPYREWKRTPEEEEELRKQLEESRKEIDEMERRGDFDRPPNIGGEE